MSLPEKTEPGDSVTQTNAAHTMYTMSSVSEMSSCLTSQSSLPQQSAQMLKRPSSIAGTHGWHHLGDECSPKRSSTFAKSMPSLRPDGKGNAAAKGADEKGGCCCCSGRLIMLSAAVACVAVVGLSATFLMVYNKSEVPGNEVEQSPPGGVKVAPPSRLGPSWYARPAVINVKRLIIDGATTADTTNLPTTTADSSTAQQETATSEVMFDVTTEAPSLTT